MGTTPNQATFPRHHESMEQHTPEPAAVRQRQRDTKEQPSATTAVSPANGLTTPERQRTLKGKAFEPRTSILDFHTETSPIAQSEFRGFFHLFYLASAFFLITVPLGRYYDGKSPIDPSLAHAMFKDTLLIFFTWGKFALLSLSSYSLIQLHVAKKCPRWLVLVVQHSTQAFCIGWGAAIPYYNKWPIVPSGFLQILSAVFFMKMHSYTATNLELLRRHGTEKADPRFPANLTLGNFVRYMCCPAFVYEPEFPSGPGFRPWYFVGKLLSFVGAATVLYFVSTQFLIPVAMGCHKITFIETLARLLLPFLAADLLVFYIMFECVCNLWGEVTNFGDRLFYEDWWNSTTFDEYARKWNRPVHEFLLRHVFYDAKHNWRVGRWGAVIATFVFSALMHELVMVAVFRVFRFYLLTLMMTQIPLIWIGKHFKGTVAGNLFFWAAIILGVPLLATCYVRDWRVANLDNPDFNRLDLL
eukprot:GDKI01010787.1.p1 GENE.GDKI01010787.1~~GDKI01010787.1.p1  ORF type:complete len:471 (+),score=118.19 GDKI01010787.1:31-1443(+)